MLNLEKLAWTKENLLAGDCTNFRNRRGDVGRRRYRLERDDLMIDMGWRNVARKIKLMGGIFVRHKDSWEFCFGNETSFRF